MREREIRRFRRSERDREREREREREHCELPCFYRPSPSIVDYPLACVQKYNFVDDVNNIMNLHVYIIIIIVILLIMAKI